MIKDFNYIFKRILIGVGIALILMLIKGNIAYTVHATESNWIPDWIYNSVTDSTYSPNTQYFNNDTNQVYYTTNSYITWTDYADLYYKYSQMNNYDSCSSTNNLVSLSGSFVSFSNSNVGGFTSRTEVSLEYINSSEKVSCSTTYIDDFKIDFTCYFTASQPVNIILEDVWSDDNINQWRYGISRTFDISCINSIPEPEPEPEPPTTEEIISGDVSDIKDSITDDNVDSSISNGGGFFSNFSSDSHGLSGIVTAPLRLLNSFTTATCTALTFQLPIIHTQVTLPCMRGIYEQYFGVFFSLYQLITTGLICYHVLINIYKKVRDLQNPNNDRIEVLNL